VVFANPFNIALCVSCGNRQTSFAGFFVQHQQIMPEGVPQGFVGHTELCQKRFETEF